MKINLFPEEKNTQTSIRICAFKKLCVDKFSYIKKRAHLARAIDRRTKFFDSAIRNGTWHGTYEQFKSSQVEDFAEKKKNASALKELITDHRYILIAVRGTRSVSFKLLLCLVPDLNIAS